MKRSIAVTHVLSGTGRLLIALFIFINSAFAQEFTPVDYLGIENGLSNNAVTCIYQDRHGFMWFGTYDGLNKYDGYNFKVFRKRLDDTTSLISNRIVAIQEDFDDNLWIGTKSGLSLHRNSTSRFSYRYYLPWQQKTPQKINQPINDIEKDSAGNIFIATGGGGLMVFRKGAQVAEQLPFNKKGDLITNYHVQSMVRDQQQRIWLFIQSGGLCRYDYATDSLILVSNQVWTGRCLETDNKGTLWLGTENGLVEYNINNNSFRSYTEYNGSLSSNNVVNLCYDKKQELWIATDGGGINILQTQTGTIKHLAPGQNKRSLTSTAVYAIYEDKESRKWIGTLRGGINIIDQQKNRFRTIARDPVNNNSLVNNFVLSFCEDPSGNLWIGTDGGGLSYWNRSKDQYTHYVHHPGDYSSISNNFTTNVIKDYLGDIWVATYGGGINRYNKKEHSFQRYACMFTAYNFEDRNVWTLYEDRDSTLWAGTCNGGRLYWYNRARDWFELFDESLTDIITMAEDSQGNLWAGTFSTLIKIDKQHKQHKIFKIGSAVRAVYEDHHGNCWIGTEGGGLLLFDREKGTYTRFTETDGLSSNSVLNILEDKQHNLWISTFNGLSKFDPVRKTFRNFYEPDGLQSNQFNYNAAMISAKGEFLFGGIKGFNIFYPDSIRTNGSMPDLLLTGLKIDNVPVEQDNTLTKGKNLFTVQEITLPYNKAVLSVDFVAPEYSAPGKIAYAYYLEGWDKDWNYVGNLKSANYSRLNEGDYTLRIKSTNAEGIWNTKERIIHITVLPPWYRTWWAYLLYAALAAGVLYLYIHYKNRQALLQYEIKIAHIQAEKEKELNENKLSFFTNIAHEFRTPLTLIINPVKELLYSNNGQLKDTGDLNIVYRNARRLLSLVDQLLLFRKAGSETGKLRVAKMNFAGLCREVYLCFTRQAAGKHIQYEFECDPDAIELYADREKIEIALFNLLSNALKFTPDGGRVVFRVQETAGHVEVAVQDSGCGIPEGTGNRLFEKFYQSKSSDVSLKTGFGIGLNVVKKFVEGHKGSITYASKKDEGTTFYMKLLKGKDHFEPESIYEDESEHSGFLEELIEEAPEIKEPAVAVNTLQDEEKVEELVSDMPCMLIVDDDEPIRQYLVQLFRDKFKLLEAANGEAGLELARQYVPDIIISDVLMQGISGIELCNSIRETAAISHVPVILLTSSSSADVKLKGIECGADDYITKPFDKELLVARVDGILRSRNNLQKYFYNEVTLQKNDLKISPEYKEFLDRCIAIVEQHLEDEHFSIKTLATEIGMSHSNLYKKVKSVSGQSVTGFIRFIRLRKAAALFINTTCNVNEAAFQVGISDIKYFREHFYKLFGMNPSAYIKKYRKPFQKNFTVHKKAIK